MFTDNMNFYGTNLDGNMVVLANKEEAIEGVLAISSDLFEAHEQFFRVKKVEKDKVLHGGRKTEYSFEKNRLELVPLKGIQVIVPKDEELDGYVYTIADLDEGEYSHETPIKKNQPLLVNGKLFFVEDVEKTGKKSGVLKVSNYPLTNVLQHLYVDNRWSKKNGRFEPVGLCKTHREFILRRFTNPEKDPE